VSKQRMLRGDLPRGSRTTAVAAILIATSLVLMAAAASATAAHHPKKKFARLTLAAKPASVEQGATVDLSGKVKGMLPSPAHRYQVSVQSGKGKKLTKVGSAQVTSKRGFAVHFQAATPGTLTLRLQLSLGGKKVSRSKPWKLVVRPRRQTPSPAPSPAPQTASGRKTVVLAPNSVTAAPPPGEFGTLRLTGVSGLNVGDIIAVGIGPATPDGFLGKVVSVAQEGGELVVGTVLAELPEALPEGEFDQEIQGEEFDTANPGAIPDSAPAHLSSSSEPVVMQHVNISLKCAASAAVQVSGNVAINPKIEIGGGWGPFSGLHAKFIGSVEASSELAASAEAAASCKVGPQTLFKKTMKPIEFSVGPIPVVVVPILSATLSAEGKVEASVATEVHGSVTAKAGIEYSKGDVHPVAGFEKNFGWTKPEPDGKAHLEATVSPTLNLLVYGVGGPSATFNAGLAVDADTNATPAWTLTAPISLTAKLAIPALHISTGDLTVYEHTFLLAQADEESIQGQIHFDELPEGTEITDQYAGVGVVFDSPVYITSDGSNPASPVLSGEPRFEGAVVGHFVVPGTEVPTTVNELELDAGYIDNPGSVEIVAQLANGQTRTAIADHLGIDQISMATRGIESFTVQEVSEEDNGFAIDNLGFSR
jgi:hypothetical protein